MTTEQTENKAPEQTENKNERELLVGYGSVLVQLLESERFRSFLELNYTIDRILDDEEKTVTLRVIEHPPEIIMKKMQEKMQQEQSQIQVVSEPVAKKILSQAKAKAQKTRR